jgi:hypothetical protein
MWPFWDSTRAGALGWTWTGWIWMRSAERVRRRNVTGDAKRVQRSALSDVQIQLAMLLYSFLQSCIHLSLIYPCLCCLGYPFTLFFRDPRSDFMAPGPAPSSSALRFYAAAQAPSPARPSKYILASDEATTHALTDRPIDRVRDQKFTRRRKARQRGRARQRQPEALSHRRARHCSSAPAERLQRAQAPAAFSGCPAGCRPAAMHGPARCPPRCFFVLQ